MNMKKVVSLLLSLGLALSLSTPALCLDIFQNGQPSGVAATADGTLLVTDVYNKIVWQVKDDAVSQYAGLIGVAGLNGEPGGVYHDGAVDQAYFMEPWDVVPFLKGYAVSDAGAHVVRYVANGRVYTFCGSGKEGSADGTGKAASFERPTGLALDGNGVLYVADAGNGTVRRVDADGRVTTVAKGLSEPTALCWSGGTLYVVETGRNRVCRIVDGKAEPFAGASDAAADGTYYGGYVDGPIAAARFAQPQGIAAGEDGTLYVADSGNAALRAIRDGRVYTVARQENGAHAPACPRGLLLVDNTLYAADRIAGDVLSYSVAEKTYADVAADAWYAAAVRSATRNGIASGTSDTEFTPNGTMNRAMFVTMLSRMHRLGDGSLIIDGDATFADVEEDSWYEKPVRWAADHEIVLGEDGSFAPLRSITRQELVTILYRYAQADGLDVSASDAAFRAFPDAADTAGWAREAMAWACAGGILRGDDEGRLNPGAQATRAQALTMLLNFMEKTGR